jgi:hypothetical protein
MSYIRKTHNMKKIITTCFTALLLAGTLNTFADKLPKREYVNLPAGRNITMQASINHLGHANGTVAVDLVIDRKGNVISAQSDRRHTTVRDKAFVHRVEAAVKGMKFNKDRHAPNEQKASLAYSFR